MNKLLLSLIGFLSISQAISQYCMTGGPSQTADSNIESLTLTGASGSINFTGCPGVVGVQEFLTQTATLNAGGNYTTSIQFGTCNGNYSGVGQAWIDFNIDGIFSAGESIGTWTGTPPVPLSNFNFTVPAGAVNGQSRMRVIQAEGQALPLNPCLAFTWGSTTDFSIVIQGGSGMPAYCTGGPSQTGDSNLKTLLLNGNSGSFINYTGCPGVTGVQQWAGQTANLGQGNNYSMNLEFGTCGGNYAGAGQAWIDFNQNSIFEAGESVGTWTGTPPGGVTVFNFTVPVGATLGATKMRVSHQEAVVPPLDPCATFTWGSMTDFNIMIEIGVDCSGYIGDDTNDPRSVPSLPFTENHDNSVCYSNQNTVYASPDVYYLVLPGAVNSLEVSLCGSSFDTFLSIIDTDGNVLAINDDHADCGLQSKLTVATAGHDSLYVIVDGYGFDMGPYTITINEQSLSILEINSSNFDLFPNPATSSFSIGNNFDGEIQVLDSRGRIVLNQYILPGEAIDISSFTKGIYFVNFTTDNAKTTKKLILQ